MYSEVQLPDEAREFLSSLGRPIRVLRGNAWAFTPPTSWRGAAGDNGTTLADCESRGLTIVSWASDNVSVSGIRWVNPLPGEFFEDGASREPGRDLVEPFLGPDDDDSFDVDGNIFARTAERTVWITTDLANLPDGVDWQALLGPAIDRALSDEWALFAAWEEAIRENFRLDEEAHRREERARASAAAREQFIRAMSGQTETRREQLRRTLRDAEQNITYYSGLYQTTLADARDARQELATLENAPDQMDDSEFEDQWQQLLAHPKVEEVSIERNKLVIHTVGLNITCNRTQRMAYLGKFQIKIPPTTRERMELVNLDNSQYDRDSGRRSHPHVNGDNPCWGDSETLIGELRTENQIPALLEITLQYLESYNPDDSWGSHIDLWLGSGTREGALDAGTDNDEAEDRDLPGYREDEDCNCYDCRAERLGYDPDN